MNALKILTTTLLLVTMLGQPVAARQDQNGKGIDRSQAAERAQQVENGRVLRVDQTRNKYRVKVLKKNGRVVSVDVDKQTGRVQPSSDKDNKH